MSAESVLGLEHHDFTAAQREPSRDREADDAGADYGAFDSFCHNPVESEKARILLYIGEERES